MEGSGTVTSSVQQERTICQRSRRWTNAVRRRTHGQLDKTTPVLANGSWPRCGSTSRLVRGTEHKLALMGEDD